MLLALSVFLIFYSLYQVFKSFFVILIDKNDRGRLLKHTIVNSKKSQQIFPSIPTVLFFNKNGEPREFQADDSDCFFRIAYNNTLYNMDFFGPCGGGHVGINDYTLTLSRNDLKHSSSFPLTRDAKEVFTEKFIEQHSYERAMVVLHGIYFFLSNTNVRRNHLVFQDFSLDTCLIVKEYV